MTEEAGRGDHIDGLDVLRGATIAAMILVNIPGDWNTVFPSLVHADWNGLTFADVVFPFFVFTALRDAVRVRPRMPRARGERLRLIRRVAALVGFACVNSALSRGFFESPHPGVLQRLGVAYFCRAHRATPRRDGQAAAAAVPALNTGRR